MPSLPEPPRSVTRAPGPQHDRVLHERRGRLDPCPQLPRRRGCRTGADSAIIPGAVPPEPPGGTMQDELEIRDAAIAWLATNGPATADELLDGLDLDGAWTAQELREVVLDLHEDEPAEPLGAFPLTDGRPCDLTALLEGVVLTHEITTEERGDGTVAVDPDLGPLHILSPDGRTLPRAGGPGTDPLRLTQRGEGLTG